MRILIISDVHGNDVALRTILNKENYDEVWFLGDITDYGPSPEICIDMLKDLKPEIWITGNHDYANAFGVDCRCGEKTHELSVYTRENITQKRISKEDLKLLRSLPTAMEIELNGNHLYFVHGCPANPLYGYMFTFRRECMKNEIGREINATHLFYGHTHYPVKGFEHLHFLNPGSVGQPRDGNPKASYAIYDTENEIFTLKRMSYDVLKTIEKLKALNLESKFEKFLISILKNGKI